MYVSVGDSVAVAAGDVLGAGVRDGIGVTVGAVALSWIMRIISIGPARSTTPRTKSTTRRIIDQTLN
jgi:hypothetical protein